MITFLSRLSGLMIAGGILFAPLAAHAEAAPSKAKTMHKASKTAAPVVQDEDELEPDVRSAKNYDYKCELGNSLTMYTNAEDHEHIAMRWKKRLYRMHRVDTTTGAYRYENKKAGFIWIGIPAKSLLLDSRKGQQLANECVSNEAMMAGNTTTGTSEVSSTTTQLK